MSNQADRAERFGDLHHGTQPLLLPNPWDQGSARLFASLGFEALATTSSGSRSVRRVSVGGCFAFAALGAAVEAARELLSEGTYGYLERAGVGLRSARAAFSDGPRGPGD